nr:DUF2285 domain-containing protein [Alphaproteobacteria bacterium]
MRSEQRLDWRSKESYAYTARLTRLGWAWEFLRRNPRFREEHEESLAIAEPRSQFEALRHWGLLRTDDPAKNALEARLFWDPGACPHVLPLVSGCCSTATDTLRVPRMHHVLICDGVRRLQLSVWVMSGSEPDRILTEAVVPTRDAQCRWRALNCFNDYLFSGALPQRHFRSDGTSDRLTRVVQVLDGARSGAPHREIAIALYGHRGIMADW